MWLWSLVYYLLDPLFQSLFLKFLSHPCLFLWFIALISKLENLDISDDGARKQGKLSHFLITFRLWALTHLIWINDQASANDIAGFSVLQTTWHLFCSFCLKFLCSSVHLTCIFFNYLFMSFCSVLTFNHSFFPLLIHSVEISFLIFYTIIQYWIIELLCSFFLISSFLQCYCFILSVDSL